MTSQLLDIYTDYLICQNQYASATGLASMLDHEVSHDKVTRFLNNYEGDAKQLWDFVKTEVRQLETHSEGFLVIDDSIEEKPYTDINEINSWHYSHTKGRCVKGINILSSLIVHEKASLPIGYEVITKDLHYCEVESKKEKRKSSKTKNELFRDLLNKAVENQIKFSYVLADNWFSSKGNLKYIHYDIKKLFITGVKANRVVATSAEEDKKKQYQKISELDLKDGEIKQVWLKDIAFPVNITKKVFKNEDNSTGVLYLITNDLTSDAAKIYEIYQKRWNIEVYHKSIKQNASLAKSPTKVVRSQKNHIFASLIAYCKLEFLKIKTKLNHFALRYKLVIKANLMAYQELAKIRKSHELA